ncbi:MAG: hypothetical protein ABI353_19830 [Isosphaeraceae bacterium]
MAGMRTPGPVCQATRPIQVRDGTLCLSSTPRPFVVGRSGVGSWDRGRKLLEAARRATDKLPEEMREQFSALFSPENLAITAGVLTAWGASHLIGVGEIIDLILLAVGAVTIGWQIFQIAGEIKDYVSIAVNAETEDDLDRAAGHLATAVSTIGVTTFVALILHHGAKQAGRIVGPGAARSQFFGQSVEDWLIRLGRAKEPPLVQQRVSVALKFLSDRMPSKSPQGVEGALKGIDFSKDVLPKVLKPGDEIVTYARRIDPKRPGQYAFGEYYTKPGTATDRLGINPGSGPDQRYFVRLRVKEPVPTLESRASEINDTWTVRGKRPILKGDGSPALLKDGSPALTDAKWQAGGGGVQYLIPDVQKLIQDGVIEVIHGQ